VARLEGLDADDRVRVGLGPGGEDGADGEIVDGEVLGGSELGGVVGGEAEDGLGTYDGSGVCGREVRLADMKTEAEEGGVVCPVIENEISFSLSASFEGL